MAVRVLALSGSLRSGSYNTRLLRAAAALLPPAAEAVAWERLGEVPPFDEDAERLPQPPAVADLRAAIRAADAVLVATPEYNRSVPGQLKNALDWVSRPVATNPLRGKAAAVIGASTGMFGATWAQADLRKVLGAIGARVLDDELPVGMADEAFDASGRLRDPDLEARLRELVAELVESARPAGGAVQVARLRLPPVPVGAREG